MFNPSDKSAYADFFASELFRKVQTSHLYEDSKTFSDAIAKTDIADILEQYETDKSASDFDLKDFVQSNFTLPDNVELKSTFREDKVRCQIEQLWRLLYKPADSSQNDSLIALPNEYTVPGGRFREVYYWDSYFAAVGLISSGHRQLVESLLDNFIYLQQTVGLIPNGNRWYYSGRSQPPVLALLVELLRQSGEVDETKLIRYVSAIETEYRFWMDGSVSIGLGEQYKRVCKLPCGSVLNRYYDEIDGPRPESYAEDIELKQNLGADVGTDFFRDIRAACESGWDFSSRWFKGDDMASIRTTQVLPIDLNTLLYSTESFLAKLHKELGHSHKAELYTEAATRRQAALNQYCWNESKGLYLDFWFDSHTQSHVPSLATAWPLFVSMASDHQAARIAETLKSEFLSLGGLVTTKVDSGQQWDSPNGWAPLQWVAVQGLDKYGHRELAVDCAVRWLETVNMTYHSTGKFMEKYNVVTPNLQAGGGEYHVQEGFGWTNGVTLGLSDYLLTAAPDAFDKLSFSSSKLNGLET